MGSDEGSGSETTRNDLSQMKGLKELTLLVSNAMQARRRDGSKRRRMDCDGVPFRLSHSSDRIRFPASYLQGGERKIL